MNTHLDAAAVFDSPVGDIFIGLQNQSIVGLEVLVLPKKRLGFHNSQDNLKMLKRARNQLEEFFGGCRSHFELPLRTSGTAFQMAVWQQIQKLGKGEASSYGAIAVALGNPMASRAVGAAVAANPIPIIIGCHRILGSNGKITGYSGGQGLETKRWLLIHEQIEFKN